MVLAGADILASDVFITRYIRKQATEAVTSSVTLQDDDELMVALAIGNWHVRLIASANSGSSTPNIKIAWTFSGTATTQRHVLGPGLATTDNTANTTAAGSGIMRQTAHGLTTAIPYGLTTSASIREDILLEVTVAGTLQLQWAQNTSNATATNVTGASFLLIDKLEAPS